MSDSVRTAPDSAEAPFDQQSSAEPEIAADPLNGLDDARLENRTPEQDAYQPSNQHEPGQHESDKVVEHRKSDGTRGSSILRDSSGGARARFPTDEMPTVISQRPLSASGSLSSKSSRVPLGASGSQPAAMSESAARILNGRILPGERLGHFELLHYVGGGGMGKVFRALDTRLARHVALKILAPEQAADHETVLRFQNEAQSAARLDHDNIARVHYVGEDRGLHFIAFEFIDGVNVRDLVESRGPLPLGEATGYALQVADALAHASSRNVVHRDIKPSNLIITPASQAKLIDMGLARLREGNNAAMELTASGVTMGTFDYISPEQARDPRNADVRSDIYSLGCTWFFMLTGRPPFLGGTVLQKLLQHQADAPPEVRQLRPDLPEEASRIMRKMLAKEPKRRYGSAEDLVSDLLSLAQSVGLTIAAPGGKAWLLPAQRPAPAYYRHLPWIVSLVLLLAIVALLDRLWDFMPNPVPAAHPPALNSPALNYPLPQSNAPPLANPLSDPPTSASAQSHLTAPAMPAPSDKLPTKSGGDFNDTNAGKLSSGSLSNGSTAELPDVRQRFDPLSPTNSPARDDLKNNELKSSDGSLNGAVLPAGKPLPASVPDTSLKSPSGGMPAAASSEFDVSRRLSDAGLSGIGLNGAGFNGTSLNGSGRFSVDGAFGPQGPPESALKYAPLEFDASSQVDRPLADHTVELPPSIPPMAPFESSKACSNSSSPLLDGNVTPGQVATGPVASLPGSVLPAAAPRAGVLVVCPHPAGVDQFATLQSACNAAVAGDVIELRFNGIQDEPPVKVAVARLTIRAGDGFTPLLRFKPADAETAKSARAMISVTSGRLTLIRLGLELIVPRDVPAENWSLLEIRGSQALRMEKCTLSISNASMQQDSYHRDVAFFRVRAALDAASELTVESPAAVASTDIDLTDCFARGEATLVRSEDLQPIHLDWDNGLLVTTERLLSSSGGSRVLQPTESIQLDLRHVTAVVHQGLILLGASRIELRQLLAKVNCSDCIFVGGTGSAMVEQWGDDPLSEMRERIAWTADRNDYSGFDAFWSIRRLDGDSPADTMRYDAWRAFWSEGRENLTHYGKISWRRAADSDRALHESVPADYVLSATDETPGRNGASDGRDLGVLIDRLPAETTDNRSAEK